MNIPDIRNYEHASWTYEKISENIKDFQDSLDNSHEVGVMLASFGETVLMTVTDIGFQNPNLLYFYGFVNGVDSQLIQHMSQLNFLLTSVPVPSDREPNRIGFVVDN